MRRADIEVPNTTVYVNYWVVSACYPRGNFYPLSDDHYDLLSYLLDLLVSQLSSLIPLRSMDDFQPS